MLLIPISQMRQLRHRGNQHLAHKAGVHVSLLPERSLVIPHTRRKTKPVPYRALIPESEMWKTTGTVCHRQVLFLLPSPNPMTNKESKEGEK